MIDPLESLIWLSHELGRPDRGLIAHREGEVSARSDEGRFWVKAQGAALATLTPGEAVECRWSRLAPLLEQRLLVAGEIERTLLESRVSPDAPLPALEAATHGWLLQLEGVRFVARCSPPHCLALACAPAGEAFAEQRYYPDQVRDCGAVSVWAPYAEPCGPAAREIRSRVTGFQRRADIAPRLILVENCGVIAAGPTAESVLTAVIAAEKSARVFLASLPAGGMSPLKAQQVQRLQAVSSGPFGVPVGGPAASPWLAAPIVRGFQTAPPVWSLSPEQPPQQFGPAEGDVGKAGQRSANDQGGR